MSEVGEIQLAAPVEQETRPLSSDSDETGEPEKKKAKISASTSKQKCTLEERLNGILCCAVCLDMPNVAIFQCSNGHLMCSGCLSHLLADGRLKDESTTCPNCRCEISKTMCVRNLAVEKAISEMPSDCSYCAKPLPRHLLQTHETEVCLERVVNCQFERIGCSWRGPFHELAAHEGDCVHPNKRAEDIMDTLACMDGKQQEKMKVHHSIFNLLSFEKITFSDLQLRPYRTDAFITKLFYETSRFSAFNNQWVVRAYVNDDQKHPEATMMRTLSYQLILKTKLQGSLNLRYLALKGPYSEMKLEPAIYTTEFSNDSPEGPYMLLPLTSSVECNKLLAAKTISIRLIMFHVQK